MVCFFLFYTERSASPRIRQVVRPSAFEAAQLQQVLPGNLYRTTPSPVGSMPVRNGSFIAAGTQSRGSIPLLQQSRGTQSRSAMVRGDQQQLGVINPGITSSRQYTPGLLESTPLTSMAAGSVQQAMPSASNSVPCFPVSSLLPDSAPCQWQILCSLLAQSHLPWQPNKHRA